MFGKSKKRAVGVLAAAMTVGALALAGAAQAATTPVPHCSASSVRVDLKVLFSTLTLDPFQVGEGFAPCADQYQRNVGVASGAITLQGLVNATSVNGVAHAVIDQTLVVIPGLTVAANALETVAAANCGDGPMPPFTFSQVGKLIVNGYPITIPAHNAPAVIALPLGIYVYLNRVQSSATGVTVDAVSIVTPLANVNIAESKLTGGPCSFGRPIDVRG